MKVLIVDDNIQIQKAYKAICNSQEWDSVIANDGLEALEIIRKQEFDVILLDIIMPRMDGLEFMMRAKKEKIVLPKTIVMTNSMVSEDAKQMVRMLGAASFNIKSNISPSQIIEKVGKKKKTHEPFLDKIKQAGADDE